MNQLSELGGEKRVKTAAVALLAIMVLLAFPIILASIPVANAVGAITLTPTTQSPGASVSVAGTGFGSTTNVGIVFGGEIQVVSESFIADIIGPDSRGYNFTHGPIKPGSFHLHLVAVAGTFQGGVYDYSDDGQGNIRRDTTLAVYGALNYALGGYVNPSTGSPLDWEYYATYIYYQLNVTSYGRISTTSTGTFSVNITVPAVANGNYNITAIDSGGTLVTSTLSVSNIIPEDLPIGVMVLLSTAAMIVGLRYSQKRPKIETCSQANSKETRFTSRVNSRRRMKESPISLFS